MPTTTEREFNNLKGFQDFRLKNSSRKCQNLVSTVVFEPNSLDSGWKFGGWSVEFRYRTPLSCPS